MIKVVELLAVCFYSLGCCPQNCYDMCISRELKPHKLVTATAVKNRLILMSITANPRQYRKSQDKLRHMWKSLEIVSPETAKPF